MQPTVALTITLTTVDPTCNRRLLHTLGGVCQLAATKAAMMKQICIGARRTSGVTGRPLKFVPRRAALKLAGKSNTNRTARQMPAGVRVTGTSKPTSPRNSKTPVNCTHRFGAGSRGGTMAARSACSLLKCAVAVRARDAASPSAQLTDQPSRPSMPRNPTERTTRVTTTRAPNGITKAIMYWRIAHVVNLEPERE